LSVSHLENVQRYLRARVQHHPQRKEPYLLNPFFFSFFKALSPFARYIFHPCLHFFSKFLAASPWGKALSPAAFLFLFFYTFLSEHHCQGKEKSPIASNLNPSIHASAHTHAHTRTRTHAHMHPHIRRRTHANAYTQTHTRRRTPPQHTRTAHTHTHSHAYTRIHTHTHTHMAQTRT
jgi:hypothetical protein